MAIRRYFGDLSDFNARMNNIAKLALTRPSRKGSNGFSLIELLVVMAIVGIIVGASGPIIGSLMRSGNANGAISGTASVLDLARQYAVSNNTYTWVVLASNPTAIGGGSIYAVILGSKDGTNTSDGVTTIDLDTTATYDLKSSSSNLTILQKAQTFRGAQIGVLSQRPSPVTPVPTGPNSNVSFAFLNTQAEALAYLNAHPTDQRVVQFGPDGQSRTSDVMSQVIELGLLAVKGNVPDPNNVAAVQVEGFTGLTRVYRN